MKKPGAFEQWIYNTWEVSPGGLGLIRITSSLYILVFLFPGDGLAHYEFLSAMPDQFFRPPPGPMSLLSSFPPVHFFQGLLVFLTLSLILLTIGYKTTVVSILSGSIIIVLHGFLFSIGKVNHELMIGIFPIVMAFSNWGAAWSVDSIRQAVPGKVESWPLTMLALMIGFMMFTAGFPKILGGWLDPSTQAVQGHLFNQYFMRGRDALMAGWLVNLDSPLFWEVLDWAAIIFEVGFLVAVWKAGWFRFFLAIAVLFHFSTMLMLNIPFIPNMLIYAAFLNWVGIDKKINEWMGIEPDTVGRQATLKVMTGIIGSTLFAFGLIKLISLPNRFFTGTDLTLYEFIIIVGAVLIVAGIILAKLRKRYVRSGFESN